MHLPHLKPLIRPFNQLPKLLLRPLLRIDNHHHSDIKLSQKSLLIPRPLAQFRQHSIINQQRRPRHGVLKRGHKSAENADSLGVRPIMDALADEIGGGAVDGLRVEEVVLGVGDAGAEGWVVGGEEEGLAGGEHGGGFVLYGEGEGGELFGEVDGDVAASAADVDDFAGAEFGPVVAVAEFGELAVHWLGWRC